MAYQSSFKAGGLIPANQMKNQNLVEDCPIPHGPPLGHVGRASLWRRSLEAGGGGGGGGLGRATGATIAKARQYCRGGSCRQVMQY